MACGTQIVNELFQINAKPAKISAPKMKFYRWYFKKTTRQFATNLHFYIGGKGTCEELGVGYLKKGLLLRYLFGKFNLHPKLI